MLHGLADRHEQFETILRRQPQLVAELVERQAVHQLHHEKRLAAGRHPGVEHFGDVGVVHHRQSLSLLLESLEHGPRVHARLDELQGDLALDRLGLLGDPDLAHAPFADLLKQCIAAGDQDVGSGRRPYSAVIEIGAGWASGMGVCTARGFCRRTSGVGVDGSVDDFMIDERTFEPMIRFEMGTK